MRVTKKLTLFGLLLSTMACPPAVATPATAPAAPGAVNDPAALFTSTDPLLHRRKQLVLRMQRELINCGQWEKVDQFMTDNYIQHNPLIGQGRQAVADFFTKDLKMPRVEKCGKLNWPVTAVIAEGDYVTILMTVTYPNPNVPGQKYQTAWFDTWRFEGDKVAEHWDSQKVCPGKTPAECVSELNPFE